LATGNQPKPNLLELSFEYAQISKKLTAMGAKFAKSKKTIQNSFFLCVLRVLCVKAFASCFFLLALGL
jgi:hypothetical protein